MVQIWLKFEMVGFKTEFFVPLLHGITLWLCCHISGHAANMISSHDISWLLLLFFGMGICINTSVFWMSSGKKGSLRGPCYNLQICFFFVCVVGGQQYSLNFILVSYFHSEMFRIMADFFLLAAFFLLAFTICGFSTCIFLSVHIGSV